MTQRQLAFTDLEELYDWLDTHAAGEELDYDDTPTEFDEVVDTPAQTPIEAYISMVLAEATASKTILTADQANAIATLDHINRKYNP